MLLWLLACRPDAAPPPDVSPPTATTAVTASTGDTAPTDTIPVDDPRVEGHGVVTCADPSARAAAPFTRVEVGTDWPMPPGYRTGAWDLRFGGRGVSVADLDGDGVLDLFVPRQRFGSRFLFGDGTGALVDRSMQALDHELRDAYGSTAVDVEGDGDVDVLVYRQTSSPVLLVNQGDGTFEPEVHAEWDPDYVGCGGTASFGDLDLDGDLDLFYGRLGAERGETYFACASTLLRNDGVGVWTDVSSQLSADVQFMRVMVSAWLPLDDDPWPELYTVADLPEVLDGNRVLDNTDGVLSELPTHDLHVETAGMGLAVGDVNEDGIVDLMIPGIRELLYMRSSAVGWIEASDSTGMVPEPARGQNVAWGGEFVDLDNDSYLDLPVLFGEIYGVTTPVQPDEVYRNKGDGTFERVGEAWGFDDGLFMRGYAVADLDGNGFVDVVKREFSGIVVLDLGTCDDSGWLTVRLDDATSKNPAGVGAHVVVWAGERRLHRWLLSGGTSYASSGPLELYVGLGDLDRVDAIEVFWPDGERELYGGADARQAVTIHR